MASRVGFLLLLAILLSLVTTACYLPYLFPSPTPTSTPTVTYTPTLTLTPTQRFPGVEEYIVILRVTVSVDQGKVEVLYDTLVSRGYTTVEELPDTSLHLWVYPENAIIYGDPACLEAIEDIRVQTQAIVNLSVAPVYRFNENDAWIDMKNIVIQLTDDSLFIP